MKNFTNNFKQFTSRLSARWLIMALMMLVGTSSAWGAYYVTGNVIGNWSEGPNNRLEMTSHESDVVKAQVSQGGDFKIHYAATGWDNDWYKTIQKGTSTGATITGNDNGSNLNLTLQSGYSFPVTIYFDPYGNDGKPYVWAIATVGSSGGDELTRIVAGTPTSVFGTEWDPGNTNNEMTEISSGVYTIDYYTNFQNNTEIKFKVTDGSWSNAWPSNDKSHTIGSGCKKTTITYNTNGNTVSVTTDNSDHCCTAPASAPSLSKVSDIVKCGTTTITSGTLEIGTVNTGSTYYYKIGTNGTEQEISLNNKQFTVSSEGDYYVKEVNDCGASSSWSTTEVTISEINNQVSISAITGPDNICSGSSADYSITDIDGVTYDWSMDSDKFTLGDNGTNSIQVTATGTADATATLTVTATKSGCPTPQTKSINLIAPITSVTLKHVKDANGTEYDASELANLTYCVGDEVWFELNYVGSKFIPENNVGYKWTTCPGNGLIGPYNGNKYKFTITSSGTIGISLRNEANVDGEGNPTWVECDLLEFKTHPEPTAPYISINPASGVICQGSSATITVENANPNCSYKLVEEEEDPEAGFTDYVSTYTVQDVAKYYVVAQHKACTNNEYTSNQVAINQIISTSATISIEPDEAVTTPWEPVTITVNPQEGYVYELSYTDNNLAGVDGVIIKQNGDSYTYYIPRPWETGDSDSDRTPINYIIKAQLKVDGEATQCNNMSEANTTITLKDEENEDCD